MNEVGLSVTVLGGLGLSFALLLAFLSRKLHVEEDPRVAKILAVLPGLNCGACGASGCHAFAEKVVKECSMLGGCLPGGDEVNNKIAELLGVVGCRGNTRSVVVCHCGASGSQKKTTASYRGPSSCLAADICGGAIDCHWGCLAFGDCVSVCPTGALTLRDRRILVDTAACIGCGKCVGTCPRGLFELVSLPAAQQLYYVACSNTDKGAGVRAVCSRGCIACGLCAKDDGSPYVVSGSLSRVDRAKNAFQEAFAAGKAKCPTKCIDSFLASGKPAGAHHQAG